MRLESTRIRRRRGFTVFEVAIVMAIVGIAAALAIPAWRNMTANNRLREGTQKVANALSMARARAIASGNNFVVYFNTGVNGGDDVCGNPLEDLNGDPVPLLILDDGPPGGATANCCIDAGEPIETIGAIQGVGWGATNATLAAPNDFDPAANFASGPTFTDPNGGTTEWVLFRPDGIPVGFQDTGGACNPGGAGTGRGALYLTNNNRDASVVLLPLGGLRAHLWEQAGGVWTN
jgi:prepilin-type N-terminal cleavage/methylation domain-containing protein